MEWIDIRGLIEWQPDPRPSSFVRLVDQAAEKRLALLLSDLGFETFSISGTELHDHESLFNAFASVFAFPEYFGKNWDAFNDSFGDFCFGRTGPIAVIWRDSDVTFRQTPTAFLESVVHLHAISQSARWATQPLQIEMFYLGRSEHGYISSPVKLRA
jgi:RNAse (barnase) inhibitor barstar